MLFVEISEVSRKLTEVKIKYNYLNLHNFYTDFMYYGTPILYINILIKLKWYSKINLKANLLLINKFTVLLTSKWNINNVKNKLINQ